MKASKIIRNIFFVWFSIACFCYPSKTKAYAMLLHEAVVDAAWDKSILPLLKHKYPMASDSDLNAARAYVYGGTVIPDVGYYPFGSMFFTDLIHYVRTGDFVQALFNEAQNLDEYAFAIGVLCHYTADIYGHSTATNRSVPILFPKEKEKYGEVITYEQDHIAHIRVEFSFDVLQTALSNYSSQSYHDFVDFKISQPVLERAFYKTYSVDLKKYFNAAAIPVLRYALKHIYQEVTEDAWRLRKNDIIKLHPLATHKNYVYKVKGKAYYKEYGKPEFKAIFFYAIIKVLPKVGPLLILKFKEPNSEVEKLFKQSLDSVTTNFTLALKELYAGKMVLKNKNFDTGNITLPGEYKLADECYYKLLLEQEKNKFVDMEPPLKNNILTFYSNTDSLKFPEKSSGKQVLLTKALIQLKAK